MVDQGVRQLSGAAPVMNSQPFIEGQPRQYAMPARTAEEVMQEQAANEAHSATVQQQRVAQANQQFSMDRDMFAELAQVADPVQPLGQAPQGQAMPQQQILPMTTQGGLVLPNGIPPQEQPQEESNGPDDGSVQWMF